MRYYVATENEFNIKIEFVEHASMKHYDNS